MKQKTSVNKNPILHGSDFWRKVVWQADLRRWLAAVMIRLMMLIIFLALSHLVKNPQLSAVTHAVRVVEYLLLEQPLKTTHKKFLSNS